MVGGPPPDLATPDTTATAGDSINDFAALFEEKCFGKIDALMAVSKEVGNEGVIESVNLYMEIFKSQSAVFNTMSICSKPDDTQFMV